MFGHRNKLQFTFSSRTFVPGANPSEGEVVTAAALGFLRPGHADQVLPIRKCLLQGPAANAVLAVVQRVCMEQRLLPADDPSGTGVMKHLIIRSSSNSAGGSSVTDLEAGRGSVAEQLMVVLVTTDACGSKQLQPVVAAIHKVPEVVSVVHSIQHAAPGTIARSSSSRAGRSPSVNSGSRRDGRRKAQQASQPSSDVDEEDGMPDSSSRRPGQSSRNRRALAIASSTVLWGRPVLTQRLCGLDFDISAHSFFQTNVAAAELLYGCVAAACEPRSTDVLLDLYCGTGTIGLSLAASVQEVVGFDVSASSIADAQANAARNGIRNARFVCGDLDQLAARGLSEAPASAGAAAGEGSRIRRSPGQKQQRGKQVGRHDRGPPVGAGPSQLPAATAAVPAVQPNVVVVDPARAGLGMPVVRYLLSCTSAHRVVYVSCNAATQARDLQRLCEPTGGFRLVAWRAVDMFPHTDHIETVAVLDRAAVTDRC
jgi:tRNA/tmRNA/rRNA uracil-C5-methylase (TrmA/RlmC/RlmD family)